MIRLPFSALSSPASAAEAARPRLSFLPSISSAPQGELRALGRVKVKDAGRTRTRACGSVRERGAAPRTPRLALLCAAFACLAALLSLPSVALGARGHELRAEPIGKPCTELVCGPEELKEPSAVAVNEATGVTYVLDQGNNRVQSFSANGTFEHQFNGVEVDGVPGGPGHEAPASLAYNSEVQISGIAVDNSCALRGLTGSACETADPSNEDVYVLDRGHEVIDKFKPDGDYIGQITEAGEPFNIEEGGGVAVDREGHQWLFQQGNRSLGGEIDSFDDTSANTFVRAVVLEGVIPGRGFPAPGLALDGDGAFYLRSIKAGVPHIEKFDPRAHRTIERLDLEESSGLAADQRTDESFVDNLTTLAAFTPTGTELERLPVPGGHGAGLAVDATSETLYTVDTQADVVYVYAPKLPGAPSVEAESVSDVSADSATLEAELNPGGAATSYRFEYGPCAGGAATCASSPYPQAAPVPNGLLGADFGIHPVAVHLQGLLAHTTYHFRLTARNEAGGTPNEVHGQQMLFITQPPGGRLTLPDGRGWELVSPPDKLGALILPIKIGVVQAATSGDGISYLANASIEADPQGAAEPGNSQILSTRSASGWGSRDLTPPHEGTSGATDGQGREYRFFSEDLGLGFVQPQGAFDPAISTEASEQSAFVRTNYLGGDPNTPCLPAMGCFRPLVTGATGVANVPGGTMFGKAGVEEASFVPAGTGCPPAIVCGPEFTDATPDGSHAILRSLVALTPTPIPGESLYEWSAEAPPASQLQLVSLLPGAGGPATEPQLGLENHNTRGAISADGSRVVFEAKNPAALYLRDTADNQTIELDAAEPACPTGGCKSGGGRFQLASADGSRVLFTDSHRLTSDAGGPYGASEGDLYECRIIEEASNVRCDLTDLTPKAGGESAAVLGLLPGASEDGQWVYFAANGALTSSPDSQGQHAQKGNCESNTSGATCNLYLLHDGRLRLVSVLGGEDAHDWSPGLVLPGMSSRVSPDGQWLALMSQRALTPGYDNRDALTGRPDAEVYLYSAASDRLICASCEPSGARPTGIEFGRLEPGSGGIAGGPTGTWEAGAPVAASVPGWTANAELARVSRYQPRYLGDQGRLFFDSADGLVPQDENGTEDVYQYEPGGVGDCTTSLPTFVESEAGCVSLMSSGSSAQESAFLDAGESGADVFFLTSSRLTARDEDGAYDVYDARVGGGEAQIVKPVECTGDACQPPATPPNDATPGSLTFNGPGNVTECPKGKVGKKGRCVKKKQKAKKHHKKHGKKKSGNKAHKTKKQGNA